jgi:hypothetical protein
MNEKSGMRARHHGDGMPGRDVRADGIETEAGEVRLSCFGEQQQARPAAPIGMREHGAHEGSPDAAATLMRGNKKTAEPGIGRLPARQIVFDETHRAEQFAVSQREQREGWRAVTAIASEVGARRHRIPARVEVGPGRAVPCGESIDSFACGRERDDVHVPAGHGSRVLHRGEFRYDAVATP